MFKFDAVSEKVRFPVNGVQQTCKGPEKLILKRRDKMLDFEAASSRFEKEKGRGDSADPARLRLVLIIALYSSNTCLLLYFHV